jgi:hypothetical protein
MYLRLNTLLHITQDVDGCEYTSVERSFIGAMIVCTQTPKRVAQLTLQKAEPRTPKRTEPSILVESLEPCWERIPATI